MRDIQILQQTLQNQCPNIHKKRLNSLILATKTIFDGAELTLTKRGRVLVTKTTVKHAIKVWWNGLIVNQSKWQYDFQASTIRLRCVLSIPRLGREVRNHRRYQISEQQYRWAMLEYQRLTHYSGLGKL